MSDNIIRKIVPFVMSLTMVLTLMPNGLFLDTYATENIQWNDILTNNPYLNSENKGIAIHEDYKVENSSYSENSYSATVSVTSEYLPHTTEPQDVAFIIDPYSYNNQNIEIANFLYQADYILNANNQSRVAVYGVSSNSEDRVELDFTRDKNAILTAITDAVNSVFETNIPNYWVLSMNNVYEDVLKSELKHHKSIIISSSYISRDDDEESPIIEYWNILKKLVPDIYFQKINYNSSDLKENERIKLARYRESLIKAIGTNEAINITTKFELNDDIYDFTSLDIESLTSLRKGCMEEFTFGYDISRDSQCTKGDNEYKVFKESYITADGNKIDFANERHNITAYNIVYQNPSSMTAITGDLPTDHTVVIDGSTFVLPYVNLSCDGFSMQGWETFSGDFYPFGSKTIIDSQIATNDNTIILTSAWSKPGGLLVSEKADVDAGQIESGSIYSICDKYDENLDHTVSQVQAIEFVQTNPPTNAKYVDVSSNKTGTVLMWTAIDSLTGYTTLYISG